MQLFVTGGTGFLGSHFILGALAAGHNVRALRRPSGQSRLALKREPDWIDGDLDTDVREFLPGCQVLVHLAAVGVRPGEANWDDCFRWNVSASLRLWRAAADAGVKRMVVCGSCFEYGKSAGAYSRIPVTAPLEPTEPYGASKAAATMAAVGLGVERELQMIILRPFHLYGEGEDKTRFWSMLRAAARAGLDFPMTAGDQVRDFVPVEIAAAWLLRALTMPLEAGHPVIQNVGTGRAQTLFQFADTWWTTWQASGKLRLGAIPYRAHEVMRYVPEV